MGIVRTGRTALVSVQINTEVGAISDPLFAANQNQRKSLEAQRKLLSAIENAGPEGLGFREWWRKAVVSSSTLKTWRPRFLDQGLVIEDSPGHYLFNEKPPRPVTLAAFTAKLGQSQNGGEPASLFRVQRGHVELTTVGERTFSGIIGKDDTRNKKDLAAHQLLDEINWLCSDGIRYNIGLRAHPTRPAGVDRDPTTGKPWNGGNCPSCHKADMKELRRWHCPNCGSERTLAPNESKSE